MKASRSNTNKLQHQNELLNTLGEMFKTGQYRLLIIDSIMNCFRVDFCGRGELSERQQKLNAYLHRLADIAERKLFLVANWNHLRQC